MRAHLGIFIDYKIAGFFCFMQELLIIKNKSPDYFRAFAYIKFVKMLYWSVKKVSDKSSNLILITIQPRLGDL